MQRKFIAAVLLALVGLVASLFQPAFGQGEHWKLLTPSVAANVAASMRLDEAMGAALTNEKSAAPRQGYKPGDKGMQRIICEL